MTPEHSCARRSYTTDARMGARRYMGRFERSALRLVRLTRRTVLAAILPLSPTVVRAIDYTKGSSQYTITGFDKPNSQG
jgi:hypothetical protein